MKQGESYLKVRRVQLGLSQQEVAAKAGIHTVQYNRFDTGERDIRKASLEIAYKVLKALEIDIDQFMSGGYHIKEILYRGFDGRLYNYETGELAEDWEDAKKDKASPRREK